MSALHAAHLASLAQQGNNQPPNLQLWRQDEFLRPVVDLLPQLRLLSLDIFDTLLFRTCERPEDVFLEVGRRAEASGLLRRGISAAEFAALRQAVQEKAYATLGREPRLEDIYAALPATLCDCDALLDLEVSIEAETCVLNPSVDSLVAYCNAAGIPVVLLSDMYLGEVRVSGLLANAGFDVSTRVERLVVSVDAGGYKMTGALYDLLKSLHPGVSPESMLHIGDNVHSDVRAARAAGLNAVHYDVVRHDPDGVRASELLVCGPVIPELTFSRRLAASMCASVSDADRPRFRVGAQVVGPFAAALVDWALDECVAENITLIAPLMREGHMLAPMLRHAADVRGLGVAVEPLYVSRQAVTLAGVRNTRDDLASKLFDYRRGLMLTDLFAMVELKVPAEIWTHRLVAVTSAHLVEAGPGQSLRAWVTGYLSSDAAQPHLQRLVRDARHRLVDYLSTVVGPHTAVATLDIGFFGQIQRSISEALGGNATAPRLTHLLGFGHGPVAERIIDGADIRAFAGSYGVQPELVKTIHRSAPVIEQLLQGPSGSTTGYVRAVDGTVTPVVEQNPLPAADLTAKAVVQRGMRAFHDLWLSLAKARPATVALTLNRREDWCRVVHRLIDTPSQAEADVLGSLSDDVNFGSTDVLPFCPPNAERDVAWNGTDVSLRAGTSALPVVWPQGVITRVDAGAIVARHAATSPTPYMPAAFSLARALRLRGITRVIGYGTGEVANAFVDAARIVGLEVPALVDSKPAMHGLRVRGVRVSSLDEAVALDVHVYAVLSVAHAGPISETVRRRYDSEPSSPLILDLTTASAR